MAQQTGLDARSVEQRLLAWAEAGYLECRAATRDPLLELLPAPKDTRERLRTLLEQYEKVQSQRVAEIVSYARTRRCRHGHISAYFGGRDIQKCSSCDNCLGSVAEPGQSGLPDEASQLQTILQTVARGWGPHNLILILRGQADAPPSARGGMTFGALAFRSDGALSRMIDTLLGAGLLEQRRLAHGGVMIELTPSGRRALGDPSLMSALLARPAVGPAVARDRRIQEKRAPYESATSEDQDLFERLSAWRLEKAQELGLRPFLVAHNSLLHAIAAARPQTESELRAVKGMGPAKMAKYGAELLSLVQEVLKEHVGPV
jgi:ATP-dependent DNA helicase RecQ